MPDRLDSHCLPDQPMGPEKSQPASVSAQAGADRAQGDGSAELLARIREQIEKAGGWLPFDRFMAAALYTPGLGYYSSPRRTFGLMPESGSDFVTAPELSPLFGHTLARQVAQALAASGTDELYEFGAGTGALAEQLLDALAALGQPVARYTIIDVSGTLRERQAQRLARFGERVQWAEAWPAELHGVVVGNEVLDAMPVQLLRCRDDGAGWLERGVRWDAAAGRLAFEDRPSPLAIPYTERPALPGMLTETHAQAEAFITSLAAHLKRGAAFFIDYGFPEAEYYHPQRYQGTLACHRAHRAEFGAEDVLDAVGEKDITAHVNFTGVALAAQNAGLEVQGYTSQGRFLINCGMAELLEGADLRERAMAQKLLTEHEMGELFKVIALATPGVFADQVPLGFVSGDRSHRL